MNTDIARVTRNCEKGIAHVEGLFTSGQIDATDRDAKVAAFRASLDRSVAILKARAGVEVAA